MKKILTVPNTELVDNESAKSKDYGIPVTTLREIKYLKQVGHENCIELLEIAFDRGKSYKTFVANHFLETLEQLNLQNIRKISILLVIFRRS